MYLVLCTKSGSLISKKLSLLQGRTIGYLMGRGGVWTNTKKRNWANISNAKEKPCRWYPVKTKSCRASLDHHKKYLLYVLLLKRSQSENHLPVCLIKMTGNPTFWLIFTLRFSEICVTQLVKHGIYSKKAPPSNKRHHWISAAAPWPQKSKCNTALHWNPGPPDRSGNCCADVGDFNVHDSRFDG